MFRYVLAIAVIAAATFLPAVPANGQPAGPTPPPPSPKVSTTPAPTPSSPSPPSPQPEGPPAAAAPTKDIKIKVVKGRYFSAGSNRAEEYEACFHYGEKPACCKKTNAQNQPLFCFLQNPFYAQCLTVDGCKASNYPDCNPKSRCGKDVIPPVSKDLPEFAACFTPWDQGGVKGCCSDKNNKGEALGCFVQNPYYAQCLTQARCKSDGFKNCNVINKCYKG